jgi:hypothetical protein
VAILAWLALAASIYFTSMWLGVAAFTAFQEAAHRDAKPVEIRVRSR